MPEIAKVYHYTNLDGVVGIVRSEALRATRCNFLNDLSELSYALDFIRDALENSQTKLVKQCDLIKFAIKANLDTFESIGIYITSFSKRKDSIELWKYYSENGGYCLEFELERMVGQIADKKSFFRLADIVYEKDIQYKLFFDFVRKWSDTIDKGDDRVKRRLELKGGIRFDDIINTNEILYLTLLFKNPKFSYEDECLAVFLVRDDNNFADLEIRLRSTNGIIVPYIEYQMNDNMNSLRSIMLGPKNSTKAAEDGLQMLLIKKKWASPTYFPQPLISSVKIEKSECPVRF